MAGKAPEITMEQRMAALRRAEEVKAERKALLERVRGGETGAEEAMASEVARRMRLRTLLLAVPGIGPVYADRIMGEARVAGGRRVGGLGIRQRAVVLELVKRYGL